MVTPSKTFDTAAKRWEGIGPYYAMFPIRFADSVIKEYTSANDTVVDPFAGRGTSVFGAMALGRRGFGIEISPVGWIYAKTKLNPAPLDQVEKRLLEIADMSDRYVEQAQSMPEFFKKCFSLGVLQFLIAARTALDWLTCASDRTLMAMILVYLHGKERQALSNQMRQTKAMSPHYAIKWWAEKGMNPPDLNPIEFMRHRIRWRYTKGVVEENGSEIFLGNSITILPTLEQHLREKEVPKAKLILTSPPYFGVTNYHYDQWLRLWVLGYEADAYVKRGPYEGRFTNPDQYRKLLKDVFCGTTGIVADDAVIYVRTSMSPFTKQATLDAMVSAYPEKLLVENYQPFQKPTQTYLFGDKTPKLGEVDLVLVPKGFQFRLDKLVAL